MTSSENRFFVIFAKKLLPKFLANDSNLHRLPWSVTFKDSFSLF